MAVDFGVADALVAPPFHVLTLAWREIGLGGPLAGLLARFHGVPPEMVT